MRALSIGEVARVAGVATSTLRYYEKAGLLPAPPRAGGQRRYDTRVLGRIRIIRLARDAGFTVEETRVFLSGLDSEGTPAARWRKMAARKMAELDAWMNRLEQMKSILAASFRCDCRRIEDCERIAAAALEGGAQPLSRRRAPAHHRVAVATQPGSTPGLRR
jgi:MerR family redox-sensitive transcriptional activator SoxR